jgi:hypothetical protein
MNNPEVAKLTLKTRDKIAISDGYKGKNPYEFGIAEYPLRAIPR